MVTRRALLSVTALAAARTASAATPNDIVVMGKHIGNIVSFDPAEAYEFSSTEILANCYRRLVLGDPDDPNRLVADLAERWEASPDGTRITFTLRNDAVFETGNAVTAEDAAFSLQRVVRLAKSPSMLLTQFGFTTDNVARLIRATGPSTLVIDLPEPRATSFVLNCLSANAGGIVERAAVLAHEQDGDLGNGWLKRTTAGAGPYRVSNWAAAEFVTLTANPRAATPARTNRVAIRHLPDPASQYLQLSKGDIDIARDLGADEIKSLAGNANLHTVAARQGTSLYIAANRAMPELARPEVVQALKWAIDYEGIARTITPQTWVVEQSFLPQGLPGALGAAPYRQDVARARALLARAGLADGFAVTMDYVTDSPQSEIAQVIQANLREIGVRVELLGGSTNLVITKTRSRNFQLALQRWSADYLDANSNAQWFGQNTDDSDAAKLKNMAWRCHFADAELTAQSLAAARENDTVRRLDIYRDMQRAVLERAPLIFLLQRTEIAGLRRAVSGLSIGVIPDYTRYAGIIKG